MNDRRKNGEVLERKTARGTQGRVAVDSVTTGYDPMSPREPVNEVHKQDITLEECAVEAGVDVAAINRALELLARWALRCGQKVLEDAGIDLGNRVTAENIKSYGDCAESN